MTKDSSQLPYAVMQQPEWWLLVKRDLYYRPNGEGYTGIRENAGRYTYEEAKTHVYDEGPSGNSVTMIRLADAPEFTKACYDDLARKHLQDKIVKLRAALWDIQQGSNTGTIWRLEEGSIASDLKVTMDRINQIATDALK